MLNNSKKKLIKVDKEAVNGAFYYVFPPCHIFDNLKSSQEIWIESHKNAKPE